ncbi:MAG: hypothetical protein Ct9H90mP2_01450 [Dehalococcoidia bacterium]|nr:MAG: hypothetical protein Ct9H90mP2_01450 [Dehalococcoidia bacterium]
MFYRSWRYSSVPNPAYPVYEIGTMFAGGETVFIDF